MPEFDPNLLGEGVGPFGAKFVECSGQEHRDDLVVADRDVEFDERSDGGADFSGILEGGGIHVGDVLHQAVISVDETGTEAAAATAVEFDTDTDTDTEPTPVVIDRPFEYAIMDRQTGAVLFLGRVVDPG